MIFKHLIYLILFSFSVVFFSCGVETELEDVVSKTWTLQWKKCGLYQSSIAAQIKFNITDSVNDGWYQEDLDTAFFYFSVIDDQTISIDSSSSEEWSGILSVSSYSSNTLEIERVPKSCEGELFSFQ